MENVKRFQRDKIWSTLLLSLLLEVGFNWRIIHKSFSLSRIKKETWGFFLNINNLYLDLKQWYILILCYFSVFVHIFWCSLLHFNGLWIFYIFWYFSFLKFMILFIFNVVKIFSWLVKNTFLVQEFFLIIHFYCKITFKSRVFQRVSRLWLG